MSVAESAILVLPLSKGELEGVVKHDNYRKYTISPNPSLVRRGVFRNSNYLGQVGGESKGGKERVEWGVSYQLLFRDALLPKPPIPPFDKGGSRGDLGVAVRRPLPQCGREHPRSQNRFGTGASRNNK